MMQYMCWLTYGVSEVFFIGELQVLTVLTSAFHKSQIWRMLGTTTGGDHGEIPWNPIQPLWWMLMLKKSTPFFFVHNGLWTSGCHPNSEILIYSDTWVTLLQLNSLEVHHWRQLVSNSWKSVFELSTLSQLSTSGSKSLNDVVARYPTNMGV